MVPKSPNLGNLPHQIREQINAAPERIRELKDRFRENPRDVLESPVVRAIGLIILGLLLIFAAGWFARGLTPGGPAALTEEATPWSVLYVACTNPACLATATIKRERDFNEWPIKCDKCGRESVYRARACTSCGQWYAVAPGGSAGCPHCAKTVKPEPQKPTDTRPRQRSDDDEDPW